MKQSLRKQTGKARSTPATLPTPDQQGRDDDAPAIDVAEILAGLTESERLALVVRFGSIRMCAALTHGHSFESSIFRLPAKCAGCHELVWGPFTRGCTCLTCKLTAHRSCTGMASMPQCPTKALFADFCRSELGLPSTARAGGAGVSTSSAAPGSGGASSTNSSRRAGTAADDDDGHDRAAGGDLEEWAKVEGTADQSCGGLETDRSSAAVAAPPVSPQSESAPEAVPDLRPSFSWSPVGADYRKRPAGGAAGAATATAAAAAAAVATGVTAVSAERGEKKPLQQAQEQGEQEVPTATYDVASAERGAQSGADVLSSASSTALEKQVGRATATEEDPAAAVTADAAGAGVSAGAGGTAPAANADSTTIGIRGVGKMSFAGGVVGAVLGGPCGAMVGLKLGAFLGAGRWSVQGLWQRIEKDRKEAGAEGIFLPKASDGVVLVPATAASAEALPRKPRDVWARIAEQIEDEREPLIWELEPEQEKLLEQGECDAGEVAMFVVGKVLAEESAMPSRLYDALLAEFRCRHRLCDCRRPIRRRSSDTDMVALFPQAGGSRRAIDDNRVRSAGARDDGTAFFASTPGLEKTFSFVEEAEIVEGEGSDTAFGEDGDEDSSGLDGSDRRDGAALQNTRVRRASRETRPWTTVSSSTPSSPEVTVAPAGPRRAAAAIASRDSWRNNSSRIDSWVELEGMICSSCGGRVASGGSQVRSVGSLGGDAELDDGGLGEGWAAADAPPCWCADEGGLSASPETVHTMPHAALHRDVAANRESESVPTPVTVGCGEAVDNSATGEAAERCNRSDLRLAAPGEATARNGRPTPAVQVSMKGDVQSKRQEKSCAETGTAGGTTDEDERQEGEACDALRDVHGVLRELTRAVLAWCPLLTASDEAAIQAVNCIDQRVFSETYGPVYGHIASGQARERDEALARRMQKEERSRMVTGRPNLTALCRPEALASLRAAGAARTGRDKLGFLVQAVERISDALPAKATTDTLLWSLCRHLAAATASAGVVAGKGWEQDGAPLPRPHAEVAFVEQFVRDESWLMGKQGYVLTTVDAALRVLLDPDMSDEVFLDQPEEGAEDGQDGDGGGVGDVPGSDGVEL